MSAPWHRTVGPLFKGDAGFLLPTSIKASLGLAVPFAEVENRAITHLTDTKQVAETVAMYLANRIVLRFICGGTGQSL